MSCVCVYDVPENCCFTGERLKLNSSIVDKALDSRVHKKLYL